MKFMFSKVVSLKKVDIKTKEYPGFPTDLQAQLMTLACISSGVSSIGENILRIDLCMFLN